MLCIYAIIHDYLNKRASDALRTVSVEDFFLVTVMFTSPRFVLPVDTTEEVDNFFIASITIIYVLHKFIISVDMRTRLKINQWSGLVLLY